MDKYLGAWYVFLGSLLLAYYLNTNSYGFQKCTRYGGGEWACMIHPERQIGYRECDSVDLNPYAVVNKIPYLSCSEYTSEVNALKWLQDNKQALPEWKHWIEASK